MEGDNKNIVPSSSMKPPSDAKRSTQYVTDPRRSTLPGDDSFDSWMVGDRYEIKRLLGRGSYGSVAEAFDKKCVKSSAYPQMKYFWP
jgi:hypothetical protein